MIHIITTGGTIEGIGSEPLEANSNTPRVSIGTFLRTANISFSYILGSSTLPLMIRFREFLNL
ncbi:hypothetical protein JM83_0789 [Gillisia sp. Hel_I_86]|nr:hypothetical protein JM83_0789 [Gillisia sp. Hel_I_86]